MLVLDLRASQFNLITTSFSAALPITTRGRMSRYTVSSTSSHVNAVLHVEIDWRNGCRRRPVPLCAQNIYGLIMFAKS